MIGSLATFGYSDPSTLHELVCALIANKRALIIDTRLRPVCSWSPVWTKDALHERFGKRYIWRGDWLGNVSYARDDAPIALADSTQGIAWLVRGLEQGYTLLLLCGCKHYEGCHRKVIYTLVKETLGERLPEYVLGQRVLTPRGPGTIDTSIPLEVHRARNRYAVNLDIPNPARYFFPCELEPYDVAQIALFA
jgi:hypothetical protein